MESLLIWPDMPLLSIIVIIAVSMIFLFLAREPMHKALQALSDGTAGGFRKIADWSKLLADKMQEKNRKVLLESGIGDLEHKINEEFKRLEASYTKHLADYPKLHLKLDDSITKIDSDYKECGQVTPEAPGWNEVVASIAKVQGSSGDRVIEKMLSEIHKSAIDGEKKALTALRKTTASRHKVLSSMEPVWKKISKLMDEVNHKVELVLETTSKIGKYMTSYEKLRQGSKESVDMLSARATKLFIVSMIVITVVGFGAFINFKLIATPMSELVQGGARVAGMSVADISALVIICLEVALGIFLTEAIGVTNIFPQVAGMSRGKRRLILYASLFGILFLALVEASLAILREVIAQAGITTQQALSDDSTASVVNQASDSSLTKIGQATLGFVLPWVLAITAIPLEMFIESFQHVLAKLASVLMAFLGHINRALGYVVEAIIKIIIHLYDAYIIIPDRITRAVKNKG